MKNRWLSALLCVGMAAGAVCAVPGNTAVHAYAQEEDAAEEEEIPDDAGKRTGEETAPELSGHEFEKKMDFSYVEGADVYYYADGYKFIDVYDSARYLLVPEGGEIPADLDSDVVIMHKPQRIYLAATGAMALFNAIDALDSIRMSSLNADDWYVQEAVQAMEEGKIVYAGKYSAPDFEMLLSEGCDLAIESTMILHSPKVQEMIEKLGIPVFIDRSSYETHPLGRTEWVKIYGAMLDLEDTAEAFFETQARVMDDLEDFENTGKTVAFFYMNSDGSVVVRRPGDSVPQMIELAGGKYVLSDVGILQETERSSVSMTMEEFYANAVNADYIIYNSSIAAPIYSIDDLIGLSPLFADFKAVQEGNVWLADKYLYQATDIVGELIRDFNRMLTDGSAEEMTFLRKLS